MSTISLITPESAFVPHSSSAAGELIDNVRGECGLLLQGIDWICRQFGFDLIGAIFNPIAGDFAGADRTRLSLGSLGNGLQAVASNYESIATALPHSWAGEDATAAQSSYLDMAEGHRVQAQACMLMSTQVGNMMTCIEEGVKFVASVIGMLADELLSIPIAKVIELIFRGAAKVRRWIGLIQKAIDVVRKLQDIVPPLLDAAKMLSLMMYSLKALMTTIAVGVHAGAAANIDETAAAGMA